MSLSGLIPQCFSQTGWTDRYYLTAEHEDQLLGSLGCAALSMAGVALFTSMPITFVISAAALSAFACITSFQVGLRSLREANLLVLALSVGSYLCLSVPMASAVLLGSVVGFGLSDETLGYKTCAFYNSGVIRTRLGFPRNSP